MTIFLTHEPIYQTLPLANDNAAGTSSVSKNHNAATENDENAAGPSKVNENDNAAGASNVSNNTSPAKSTTFSHGRENLRSHEPESSPTQPQLPQQLPHSPAPPSRHTEMILQCSEMVTHKLYLSGAEMMPEFYHSHNAIYDL